MFVFYFILFFQRKWPFCVVFCHALSCTDSNKMTEVFAADLSDTLTRHKQLENNHTVIA